MQRKSSKKDFWKVPKSFLRRKDKKHQYAREWYRNSSEEQKEKKCKYVHEQYKNLLENEYRKIFSRMQWIETGWV